MHVSLSVLTQGHYTALCYNSNSGGWLNFNDAKARALCCVCGMATDARVCRSRPLRQIKSPEHKHTCCFTCRGNESTHFDLCVVGEGVAIHTSESRLCLSGLVFFRSLVARLIEHVGSSHCRGCAEEDAQDCRAGQRRVWHRSRLLRCAQRPQCCHHVAPAGGGGGTQREARAPVAPGALPYALAFCG